MPSHLFIIGSCFLLHAGSEQQIPGGCCASLWWKHCLGRREVCWAGWGSTVLWSKLWSSSVGLCRVIVLYRFLVDWCLIWQFAAAIEIYIIYYTTLQVCYNPQLGGNLCEEPFKRLTSLSTPPTLHLLGCWPRYDYKTIKLKCGSESGSHQSPLLRWTLIHLNNRWCFLWGPFPRDINRFWCSNVQWWCWDIN